MGEISRAWPDDWGIEEFLDDQSGVVSRAQLLAAGETPPTIRRMIRRRELAIVHPGVCVRRIDRLSERVLWNTGPPRLRYEDAAIDVAGRARSDLAAVVALADMVQSRRSTASRLATEVNSRTRIPRRDWLRDVLTDIADGTCSVLEHGYLTRVVRAHALPIGERQVRSSNGSRVVYRDTAHANGLIVELDGRLFHDTASQRDADLERDLDAAVDGKDTVRLGWGQVFDRTCQTASKMAVLHLARGWSGHPQACGLIDCGLGVTT